MVLNDDDADSSRMVEKEVLWYVKEAKTMLKLIRLKDALREIFKQFDSKDNRLEYSEDVLAEARKAMTELGSPFNLFGPIFEEKEFTDWINSLRNYLFEEPFNQHFLESVIDLTSIIRTNIHYYPLFPKMQNSLDLGLDTARLVTRIKKTGESSFLNPETYRRNIIEQLDNFFDSTDWNFMVHCISYLKTALTDTIHHIYKDLDPKNKFKDWKDEQLKNNDINGYFGSEELLRTIRNVLLHTKKGQVTKDVTWYEVYNPWNPKKRRRDELSNLAKKSELGEIISGKSRLEESEVLKDKLTFDCLEKMVMYIETWIHRVINYYLT